MIFDSTPNSPDCDEKIPPQTCSPRFITDTKAVLPRKVMFFSLCMSLSVTRLAVSLSTGISRPLRVLYSGHLPSSSRSRPTNSSANVPGQTDPSIGLICPRVSIPPANAYLSHSTTVCPARAADTAAAMPAGPAPMTSTPQEYLTGTLSENE